MRARFVLILLLAVLAFGTARADEFVTGTEDVPLMPGLAMVE